MRAFCVLGKVDGLGKLRPGGWPRWRVFATVHIKVKYEAHSSSVVLGELLDVGGRGSEEKPVEQSQANLLNV